MQVEAARAVGNISELVEYQRALASMGAVPALVRLLGSTDVPVQVSCGRKDGTSASSVWLVSRHISLSDLLVESSRSSVVMDSCSCYCAAPKRVLNRRRCSQPPVCTVETGVSATRAENPWIFGCRWKPFGR